MSTESRFSLLFRKYVDGTAIHDERLEFLALANQENMQTALAQLIDAELRLRGTEYSLDEEEQQEILTHIYKTAPAKTRNLWPRIAIAAAVIGMAIGVYFYTSRHLEGSSAGRHPELVSGSQDIPPGGNNATLTVGNGSPMQLSQAQNTVVVGNDFRYGDGSSLPTRGISPLRGERMEAGIPNITATTLRGGMYTIILPDGTKSWLNNASELEFPAKFEKNAQRIVKLIGEAYFEVARDTRRPFVVQSAGQNVTVLGTHFNISAYKGEKIRTTLLEGSVRVASILSPPRGEMSAGQRGEERTLKPNQQSILTGNTLTVTQADIEEEMAWKNGYFRFNLEGIQDIMLKLSRWYNIDVAYQGKITTEKFTGTVTRDKNISQVLLMLEQTKGVHFKIEGRKVIVMQ